MDCTGGAVLVGLDLPEVALHDREMPTDFASEDFLFSK